MIISLMGFMGSGKSTFGRRLADHYKLNFIDLDDYIVENEKMSINEIFDGKGEEAFRKLENQYLGRIIENEDKCVLSLGGGTPCREQNWDLLNLTRSIYLKRTPLFLFNILKSKKAKRPLIKDLADHEIRDLINRKLEQRAAFYKRAELIFYGYGSKKALAERLAKKTKHML